MPSAARIFAASLLKGIEGAGTAYSKYATERLAEERKRKEPTELQKQYEWMQGLTPEEQAGVLTLKTAGAPYLWAPTQDVTGVRKTRLPGGGAGRSETADERFIRLSNKASTQGPRSLTAGEASWLAGETKKQRGY